MVSMERSPSMIRVRRDREIKGIGFVDAPRRWPGERGRWGTYCPLVACIVREGSGAIFRVLVVGLVRER
jgi:hypothetical protein